MPTLGGRALAPKKIGLILILLGVIGISMTVLPFQKCPACDSQGRIYLGQVSGQPPTEFDYLRCIFCDGASKISFLKSWTWSNKKEEIEKRIEQKRDFHLK